MTNNKPNDVRVSMAQVFKAVEYANDHPDRYLSGTTNWCAAVAFCLNRQIIEAQPADQQGEPFGYWRVHPDTPLQGCFLAHYEESARHVEAAEEMGFIVTRLYAQPATAKLEERVEFEAWYGSDDESGLGEEEIRSWRKGDRYSNQYERCNICWVAWQARAKLNK